MTPDEHEWAVYPSYVWKCNRCHMIVRSFQTPHNEDPTKTVVVDPDKNVSRMETFGFTYTTVVSRSCYENTLYGVHES